MALVDLSEVVILGPGSEWFWAMAQFVVVAVTGLAIFRQLHAQRASAVYDQMSDWRHEFDGPAMTRHKLALMLAIKDRAPSAGLPRANDEVPDYFELVGYLISRGHVNVEDFWNDSRELVSFYWGVLAPYIEKERTTKDDPTLYQWFEWLERELTRIDMRRLGRARTFDPQTRSRAIEDRIAVLRVRLDRSRDGWSGDTAPDVPAGVIDATSPDA
jgi:hypothetical protein